MIFEPVAKLLARLTAMKAAVATATPSGTITFGAPSDGSTIVVTGPSGGPFTFTKVAAAPGADEFSDITELTALLHAINGINASDNGTVITLTVSTSGQAPNAWTVTGTDSYSALSITFSGGANVGEFKDALVALFKSGWSPGTGQTYADFEANEADFSGYARSSAVTWGTPYADNANRGVMVAGSKQFTQNAATVSNTVGGYAVLDAAGTGLLFAEAFDTPVTMDAANKAIVVLPKFIYGRQAA